jgi:hypothetical protein
LPGLGLSRFRMSDFKVFLLLALVMLAASALARFLEPQANRRPSPGRIWIRITVLLVTAVVLALSGPYSGASRLVPLTILILAAALLAGRSAARIRLSQRTVTIGVILLTLTSGAQWAFSETLPWRSPRVASERGSYGSPVDALITARNTRSAQQRPGRIAAPPGSTADVLQSQSFNRGVYSGTAYVGGYVNLKGSPTADRLLAGLTDPVWATSFNSFLVAPGTALATAPAAAITPADLLACADAAQCGTRASLVPTGYSPGDLSYRVSAVASTTLLFNEPDYTGWHSVICAAGKCSASPVKFGDFDLVKVNVPAGTWNLNLTYRAPGREASWILFWLGVLFCVGVALATVRRRPPVISTPASLTEKGRPDEFRPDLGIRRQMAAKARRYQSSEPTK